MSSNSLALDFGVDVGNVNISDDANNTYFKFKAGKSDADAMALKSVVENGTGRTLNNEDHYVSIKIPANADCSELKEMVEGMTDEGLVEEVEGKDGYKWLMVSLKKTNESQGMVGDLAEMEAELKEFFDGVDSGAFLEYFMKTSHHFSDAVKIAENNNEKDADSGTEWPSLSTFMNDFSLHFRADVEHSFVTKVAKYAKKFMPVTPELFEFVKKFNHTTMALKFNSINQLSGMCKEQGIEESWKQLVEFREMAEEMRVFVGCLDDFRLFFILNDSAYLSLEIKATGLSDYVKYFAPEE